MGTRDLRSIGILAVAGGAACALIAMADRAEAQQRTPPLAETPQSRDPAAAPLNEPTEEPQPTFVHEGDSYTAMLTISGALSRGVLGWDDGKASDAYFVDNAQDGTSISVEGEIDFGEGWALGAAAGADLIYAPSDEVDQFDRSGFDNRIDLSFLYASLGQERLGTIVAGYADTASDGIDNINLAESDVIADADVISWNANFLIRPAGGTGSDLRWGDFIDGTLAGDTRIIAGYTTPEVGGFEAGAAVGESYRDVALRYQGEWADAFEVEGGIGYWSDTWSDSSEPVDDAGWGGSIAVRHIGTGLNIAVNYANVGHAHDCEEPGAVTGRCRGEDSFYYVKGGIVRDDVVAWGPSAVYGEFYRETKRFNESDPGVLRALESVPGSAGELRDSVASVWGVGVVQGIEAWNTELFLGYRHYGLDVSLIGKAGTAPAKALDGFNVIMAGAKISF